ncbi:MAG: hypothetical protein V1726_01430 [Methanobacteriota archaeon]
MLVKKHSQRNRQVVKEHSSGDTVESLRSWVRKIEQTTLSVSSRLAAVEKRLSGRSTESLTGSGSGALVQGSFETVLKRLKEEKKNKVLKEISQIIDQEFSLMQEELCAHRHEINTVKEHLDEVHSVLDRISQEVNQLHMLESQICPDFDRRMQKLERREPPVMRLGHFEIPIEVTGVIGGILAFVVAFLVWMNQRTMVISPWFLTCIGLILLGSAVVKTFHRGSRMMKSLPIIGVEVTEAFEKN